MLGAARRTAFYEYNLPSELKNGFAQIESFYAVQE
jgi:hypothetical protein